MVYMSILVVRHCVAFRNTLTLVSVHECNVKMTRQEDEKKRFRFDTKSHKSLSIKQSGMVLFMT